MPSGRAEGHLEGDRDRGDDRGRPAGRGPAGDRARRQLRASRDHGRHQDGRGRAGPREGTGAGPVMFGGGNMPDEPVWRFPGAQEPAAPPSTEQLIAAGWGYVSLSPASIQADNGAGLTAGIIGLTNEGKRRTPEQWGALRAWAWGAARALDYLETLPAVDAKRVGIEGVSRYGKAALVTMAFEPRFAVVLVGSSGRGRRQAAPPPLRGGGGEPHGVGRLPLDGRQLPQVRSRRGVLREPQRERHPGRRARAHRPLRAAPDLRQLRRPGQGRRELAGPAGELHGHGGGGPRLPSPRGAGPRRDRGLPRGADAARQRGPARRRARLAPARRRARGPLQHELLHRLGEPAPPLRAAPGPRGPAAAARRPQFPPRAPAAPGQGEERGHRSLLPGRLHHPSLGRHRLSGAPGPLERDLPRLERRQFRLGRGPDGERPVAACERRAGRRRPEGHRAPRRHQQRGQGTGRRGDGERRHPGPPGDRRRVPEEGTGGDDRARGHLPAQRQSRRDGDPRAHQRQPGEDGRREGHPVPRRWRPARRRPGHPVRGNDGGRAAPELEGL